ncbi:MAG: serine/threonine-protein kinase [Bdellovibrionota bacterium]
METLKFGKYLLIEKIAAGGMAEIYKAIGKTAQHEERLIAIKRILPEFSSDDEFISLLKDEAQLMVYLNHPNIVPIVEFGKVEAQYYIAMEYVEGTTLKGLLQKVRASHQFFTIDMAVHVVREIATGLGYAHRKTDKDGKPLNIVHRDISPSNILLSFDGEVKVADFGISKAQTQSHRTQVGIIRGKTGYMSPEQAQSGTKIDHRSDLFSLGIIFYELLTGRRLFQAESIPEALKLAREAKVEPISSIRPEVPIELEKIVLKILRKDAEDRFQTAEDIVDKLNEFLSRFNPKGRPIRITHMDLVGFLGRYFREEMAKSSSVYLGLYDQMFPLQGSVSPKSPVGSQFTETLVTNPFYEMSQAERLIDKATSAVITDEVEPEEDPERTDAQDHGQKTQPIEDLPQESSHEVIYSRESESISNAGPTSPLAHFELRKKRSSGITFNLKVTKKKLIGFGVGALVLSVSSFFAVKAIIANKINTKITHQSATHAGPLFLTITSTPSEAEIFIDGVLQDFKTPSVFEFDSLKVLTVEVRKEGFLADRRIIQEPQQRERIDFVLEPEAVVKPVSGQMSLDLYSNPSEANVFVNGVDTSKTTPTTLQLELGSDYRITLKKNGFDERSTLITANQAVSIERSFTLTQKSEEKKPSPAPKPKEAPKPAPAPKPLVAGTLNISSTPWANVVISGKVIGQTPLIGYTLPEGKYDLILVNKDLKLGPTTLKVQIKPKQKTVCVYRFEDGQGQCN